MAQTINLAERLLERGQLLAACGCRHDARKALEHLLALPDLDTDVRVEAHLLLAQVHHDCQRFRKARRQLAAVMALRPDNAEAQYRFALAIDLDPDADPRRAWKALCKAIELDSKEPAYWSTFGQVALRLDRRKTALKAFRQATKLAPTAIHVLDAIADGLTALGHEDEAGMILAAARFRLPRDPGVEGLWNRFRFDSLRRRQHAAKFGLPDGRPVLLPFEPRSESADKGFGEGVIRSDRFSKSSPHLHRLRADRPDPRHAP